jgi:hypothetical protein
MIYPSSLRPAGSQFAYSTKAQNPEAIQTIKKQNLPKGWTDSIPKAAEYVYQVYQTDL